MARPAPEAAVHDLAGVGRIAFEARELPVAHRLEHESDDPEGDARPVEPTELGATERGAEQRQRDHPGERGLDQEDAVQAAEGEPGRVTPADRLIAAVLRVPPVARGEVDREADGPDPHQHQHQAAALGLGDGASVDEHRQQKHQRPLGVHMVDIAAVHRQRPPRRSEHGQSGQTGEIEGKVEHDGHQTARWRALIVTCVTVNAQPD